LGLQTFDFLGASTENVMGLTSSFGIDGQPDPRISGGTKAKLPKSGESDKAGCSSQAGNNRRSVREPRLFAPPDGDRAAVRLKAILNQSDLGPVAFTEMTILFHLRVTLHRHVLDRLKAARRPREPMRLILRLATCCSAVGAAQTSTINASRPCRVYKQRRSTALASWRALAA
jgi:hypothetical protein